jgi:hypothetical protein
MLYCFYENCKETQFLCGYKIQAADVFVNIVTSNTGTSIWRMAWVTTNCCLMRDKLFLNMYKMQMRTKYYIMEAVRTWKKKFQEYSLLLVAHLSMGSCSASLRSPANIMTRTTGREDHVLVQILFLFFFFIWRETPDDRLGKYWQKPTAACYYL